MSLILDVQPEEYYGPFSYEATGIKLVLHEQHEWPQVENLGIDITPGYNTNIRIKRNKVPGFSPLYLNLKEMKSDVIVVTSPIQTLRSVLSVSVFGEVRLYTVSNSSIFCLILFVFFFSVYRP